MLATVKSFSSLYWEESYCFKVINPRVQPVLGAIAQQLTQSKAQQAQQRLRELEAKLQRYQEQFGDWE